jgi:hypothetical protein
VGAAPDRLTSRAAHNKGDIMSRQPMNTSVRERERDERKREFHEAVKDGTLKIRKATAAERRAWKVKP